MSSADLIREIEANAVTARAKKEVEPLGFEKILAQVPVTTETLDRSSAPRIHAATTAARKELREAYYGWLSRVVPHAEASARKKSADLSSSRIPKSH